MNTSIFHLSFPVRDIDSTKEVLCRRAWGASIGRQSAVAMMLDFHGHQIVAQVTEDSRDAKQPNIYPRHFGLVCQTEEEWTQLRDRALRRTN